MLVAALVEALVVFAAPQARAEPSASPCSGTFDDASVLMCPRENALVVDLFAAARRHDATAVRAFGPRLEGPTSDRAGLERVTYELALATAEPATYAERYVRSLVEANFVQWHLLSAYGQAGLVDGDPFALVSTRARTGDAYADAAILGATIHPLNEFDPGLDDYPIATNPRRLLAALRVMRRTTVYAYFCTKQDIGRDPGFVLREAAALRPRDAVEREIVAGMRAAARGCTAYDANA
jgi:hypothetical protein